MIAPHSLFDRMPDRALLVEGVAGSGKSTLIADEAALCVPHGKTLLVTFSRAGRDVLLGYMQARDMDPATHPALRVYTIDGLAYSLLRRLGDERFVLKREVVVTELLPGLVAEVCEQSSDDGGAVPAPTLSTQAMENLMSDLDYYRASLAWQADTPDDEEIACAGGLHHDLALVRAVFRKYETYRATWLPPQQDMQDTLLDPAIRYANTKGMYGFRLVSEAVHDLMEALDNGAELPSIARGFRFMLIDEFHDTTPLQLALLSRIAALAGRIMAVGDRYQTIFAWRGANTDLVFETFIRDFGARRVQQRQSHRFGPGLAQLAGTLTHRDITSSKPQDTPILQVSGDWSAAAALAPLARQTMLCRNGADRVRAAFSLLCHPGQSALRLAWPLQTSAAIGIATVLYALRYPRTTAPLRHLPLALQQFLSLPGCLADEALREETRGNMTPMALRTHMQSWLGGQEPRFERALAQALFNWLAKENHGGQPAATALANFADEADLFRGSGAAQRVLDEALLQGWAGLLQYLALDNVALEAWPEVLDAIASRCGVRRGVPILTVAEAKGREYDHVLVYDAGDRQFSKQSDAPDVERNRYYVACTRARKSLTLFRDPP